MANGTFARVRDILKSDTNELLDRAKNQQKMIRQSVDMPVYRPTPIERASVQNQIENTQVVNRMTDTTAGPHAPTQAPRAVRSTRRSFLPCKLVWSRQDAR